MLPRFTSVPYRPSQGPTNGTITASSQGPTNGTITASTSQQAMPSNHCLGNPTNFFPDSALAQSQMAMINPQMAIPFNNSNTYVGNNGLVAMPNRPIAAPMSAPNHSLPMQIGMPLLDPTTVMPHLGQFHGGFCPQMANSISIAPMNLIQSPNQIFAHNSGNLPHCSSQNSVFLNGQLCLQNPMQSVNQFVQRPMSNCTQGGPRSMHLYSNQVSQGLTPQNPAIFPNPQFGILHSNAALLPNQDQPMDANATAQPHNTTQLSQGNSPLPPAFASVPPQHNRKNFHPSGSSKSQLLQGNLRKDDGIKNWNNNRKDSHSRNFVRDLRSKEPHRGFSKPQFHNVQNAKGKSSFHNKHGVKGKLANSTNKTHVVQRRSLSLNYTEEEIKQWREERRQNYPSKCNVKKKLTEKHTEPEVITKDAKSRRQQLKEILAKQAELGCEVAEIPSCYLSDSEKQVHGKEVGNKALTKKDFFQKKYNKRGRYRQKERFSKKQELTDHDSSILANPDEGFSKRQKLRDNDSRTKPFLNKKQPTLLQRLLSADIRRDKHHLLQVFRFMVMNSFFDDWPEKPLRFPLVTIKVNASEGELVEEKLPSPQIGISAAHDKTAGGESKYGHHRDYDGVADYEDEHDGLAKEAVPFVSLKGGEAEELEEEEGEIID